jgi:hypothetical protein
MSNNLQFTQICVEVKVNIAHELKNLSLNGRD